MTEAKSASAGPSPDAAKPDKHDEDRDHGNDDNDDNDNDHDHDHEQGGPARKRQRIRLSCLECRRRKLSCSRELPCDRCIKSGTPDRCTYESRPGVPAAPPASLDRAPFAPAATLPPFGTDIRRSLANHSLSRDAFPVESHVTRDSIRDHDRIQRLELEVTQLKSALAKQYSLDGSTIAGSPSVGKDVSKDTPAGDTEGHIHTSYVLGASDGLDCKFIKGRNFKTRYFGPHNAWSSFQELSGICPFMQETAEEWLRPLNISKKDRQKRKVDREKRHNEPDLDLEALLPPKEETDSLITVYLDQFEQLHRIIHIPTFNRDYAPFWDPTHVRPAWMTALVLSVLSVSSCLDMQASNKFIGIKSSSFQTAEKWIQAVEAWHSKQSHKHRRLVHYQISCMLYMAKKVNIIKKKRIWTTTGALVHEGITVGLHQDPGHIKAAISPYYREMRRRLWATIVEFDLQAAFNQGVPTLLSQLNHDADPPRNIDDDGFGEESEQLPEAKPSSEYTFTSYLNLSRQSLQLRLELTRVLTSSTGEIDYDQSLRYSELISQEIDALPAWDLDAQEGTDVSHKPILAHTLLHLQLRQYLLPLFQPFLKLRQHNSKYQVAELMYYNAARDIVLMHDRLFQKGIRALYFMREDTMNAASNLCSVSLHQPRGSTSLIASQSAETVRLIEKCIALKEDRILRCGNNDPWGYSSMCAALGLLETHLGLKTSLAAKASSAERFISLHYKLLAYQVKPPSLSAEPTPLPPIQDPPVRATTTFPLEQIGTTPVSRDGLPMTMPWLFPGADADHMAAANNPEFSLDLLGTDLNDLWGNWGAMDMGQ